MMIPTDHFRASKIRFSQHQILLNFWPQLNRFELAAHRKDGLATVVMMIPFDPNLVATPGCLETMLLEAADKRLAHILPHVEQFRNSVAEADWKISRTDKMRFRSLLAASHKKPHISVSYAVHASEQIVDLSHGSLATMIEFLEKFGQWLNEERIKKFGL